MKVIANEELTSHIPMLRNASSHPTSEPGISGTQLLLAMSSQPSRYKRMTAGSSSCQPCWCWCWHYKLHWVSLVKAEGPFAGCCHRIRCSFQKPPVEIQNLVIEWKDGRSYTRESCKVQSLQCPEEERHDGGGQGDKNWLHRHQAYAI